MMQMGSSAHLEPKKRQKPSYANMENIIAYIS